MSEQSTPKPEIPPLHAYWDRPPSKDKGDQDSAPIFQWVGHATTAWEMLESGFAQIFGLFVESHSKAAERAYGAIASHSGRRDALENAAEIYFDENRISEQDRNRFRLLLGHFQNASARRNEIAHGIVIKFQINNEDRGYFLVPPRYNSRKTAPPVISRWMNLAKSTDQFGIFGFDYRYSSEDIKHLVDRFAVISGHVNEFLFPLYGRYVEKMQRWIKTKS